MYLFMYKFVVVVVWCFIHPLRDIVALPALMDKTAAAPRAALPIPTNVCSIFVCPNGYGMAASVMGF